MPSERTDACWEPWDGAGCEHLTLYVDPNEGALADGVIVAVRDGAPLRCRYRLETDPEWRLRELRIVAETPAGGHEAVIEGDGRGRWRVDGEPRPDLDGCLDVDIQATPFTNTLPIRRLGLAQGEQADLRVVYVPVPGLGPAAAEQRYTCLKPWDTGDGLYRYEGLFRGFTAELPVDAAGLVVDYRDTFRRVWPA